MVLRVRLHALRGHDHHRYGRGAGHAGPAVLHRRLRRGRAAHRGRATVRLGVPRTVASQHRAGLGSQDQRPRDHVRAPRDHGRPVRAGVQPADVHRDGAVRRVVRRPVGQHRLEVRAAVRLGQPAGDRAHQSPLVPGQVQGLPPEQKGHHSLSAVRLSLSLSCSHFDSLNRDYHIV